MIWLITKSSSFKPIAILFVPLQVLYSFCRSICWISPFANLGRASTAGLFFLLAVASSANGSEYEAVLKKTSTFQEKRSVQDVIRKVSPRVENRLKTFFSQAGVSYPPSRLTLIGLKDEMELEVWAERGGQWVYIATYDVLAASGEAGPKQKAGDRQVPEGIYRISELNPNSRFYLSMRLDYPNEYDRMKARQDGRSNLGGDIYIHGKAKSKGCLAVGDAAVEELFVLAARTGVENTQVLIVPYDFRQKMPVINQKNGPAWLSELYQKLGHELQNYNIRTSSLVHSILN